jgi:hypothetical protein
MVGTSDLMVLEAMVPLLVFLGRCLIEEI